MDYQQLLHDSRSQNFGCDYGEQVKRGIQQRLKNGFWPHLAPIGYINVRKHGQSLVVIDLEKAVIVKEIFGLAARGFSSKQIAVKLGIQGFRTRSGKQFNATDVIRIRRNPFYCGLLPGAQGRAKGKHEALVSPQEFEAAQVAAIN